MLTSIMKHLLIYISTKRSFEQASTASSRLSRLIPNINAVHPTRKGLQIKVVGSATGIRKEVKISEKLAAFFPIQSSLH